MEDALRSVAMNPWQACGLPACPPSWGRHRPGDGFRQGSTLRKTTTGFTCMPKKGYHPRPQNPSWEGGRWGCDMSQMQGPGSKASGLSSRAGAEPKQLYRKNKVSHLMVETEDKVDWVPSPMATGGTRLLNVEFWKCFSCYSVWPLLLCWVFIWCVNMLSFVSWSIFPALTKKMFPQRQFC